MSGSPQRIPPVPQAAWTDATRDVFAIYEGREGWEKGSKFNVIQLLANHPALAQTWLRYNKVVGDGLVPPRLREIAILRVAWRYGSDYEWASHSAMSPQVGLTPEHLAAVKEGPEAALWSELERAVLRAADQMRQAGDVDEATWETLARGLDRPQLLELLFVIGSYAALSWILNVARLQPEGRAG
jgi:alkylhydroperoxidase family enzyme